MVQKHWPTLPFPFDLVSEPVPLSRDTPCILERLLEDCAGLAGVVATAAQHPEADAEDIELATKVLAEDAHSVVALWRTWRKPEAEEEA